MQRLRPLELRPREEVLAAYRFRKRIDLALLLTERLTAAVFVLFAGFRVADGPVRDWMYMRPATVRAAGLVRPLPAAGQVAQAAPAQEQVVVERPVLMRERAAKRWVPRREAVVEGEMPVRPAELQRSRMAHPELGHALPSISRQARRPTVAVDYLVPALDFVPPAPQRAAAVARRRPGGTSLLATEPRAVPTAAPTPVPTTLPVVEEAPPPDLRPTFLQAPAVNLQANVVEVFLQDGVWQVADYAAGYLHGTGLPGDGNVVMAGHKGQRGAVFARLEALKVGDEIFVDATDQRFRYRVRETRSVWPSEVSVMYPTETPTLTLLTCTSWDMQRFVVIADLVDSTTLPPNAGG